ncbi:MAG: type VI secretion system baseplate subunit TssE [Holosporaceae bacterium]|jgi:type VI secretion system lysozyme-like protein|nr:type VI secretion system baseplate subunit TssE [Holosporaceae bacterium]
MTNAAIVPLFERLTDENPEVPFEKTPKRFSTFEELQNSILNDLTCLLNTRVSNSWADNVKEKITAPYAYGVNVTAPTSASNVFEIQRLEAKIDAVIKQFEPRLINAKSRVAGTGKNPCSVFVNIEATVLLDNRKTPLSFPIVMDV